MRSTAMIANCAGRLRSCERSNRAGTSFRQVKSPAPPKMTNTVGSSWSFDFIFYLSHFVRNKHQHHCDLAKIQEDRACVKFSKKDIVSFDNCTQWGVHPIVKGKTAFYSLWRDE